MRNSYSWEYSASIHITFHAIIIQNSEKNLTTRVTASSDLHFTIKINNLILLCNSYTTYFQTKEKKKTYHPIPTPPPPSLCSIFRNLIKVLYSKKEMKKNWRLLKYNLFYVFSNFLITPSDTKTSTRHHHHQLQLCQQ